MNQIFKILFSRLCNLKQQHIKKQLLIILGIVLSITLCWVPNGAVYATTPINKKPKRTAPLRTPNIIEATNWNAIHAKYAHKTYHLKDTWELVDYFNFGEFVDENTRKEIYDMKIRLEGDTVLFVNNKKSKVKRVLQRISEYQKHKQLYEYLVRFFRNQGITIGKQIPVLRLVPAVKGIYSYFFECIYISNYLVLYHKGIVLVFKYIKRNQQGLPDTTATIMYTKADAYKDFQGKNSSIRARQYGIRPYNGYLKLMNGHRCDTVQTGGGVDYLQLPNYKQYPLYVCFNYHEDEIFLIYTYKNGGIDINNYVSTTAISSYDDYIGDFAIFTDGTIYIKETNKKETRIYAYRINNDGDFYELK